MVEDNTLPMCLWPRPTSSRMNWFLEVQPTTNSISTLAPVVQRIEHQFSKLRVVGSNPTGGTDMSGNMPL